MQSLPYELLQLIASYLLPRNQCRLALTSRHQYKYLYNDLLKWHARKHNFVLPKHKIISKPFPYVSIVQVGEKVLYYRSFYHLFGDRLCVLNFTNKKYTFLDDGVRRMSEYWQKVDVIPPVLYTEVNKYKYHLCSQIYLKYIHKDCLLALVNPA